MTLRVSVRIVRPLHNDDATLFPAIGSCRSEHAVADWLAFLGSIAPTATPGNTYGGSRMRMATIQTTTNVRVGSNFAPSARLSRATRLASTDQAKADITPAINANQALGSVRGLKSIEDCQGPGGHAQHRDADREEGQMVVADHGQDASLRS
jgi:hypothetical protein